MNLYGKDLSRHYEIFDFFATVHDDCHNFVNRFFQFSVIFVDKIVVYLFVRLRNCVFGSRICCSAAVPHNRHPLVNGCSFCFVT